MRLRFILSCPGDRGTPVGVLGLEQYQSHSSVTSHLRCTGPSVSSVRSAFSRATTDADAYTSPFTCARRFSWVRAWSLCLLRSAMTRDPCAFSICHLRTLSRVNALVRASCQRSDAISFLWCVVPTWISRLQTFVSWSILLRKVRFCPW